MNAFSSMQMNPVMAQPTAVLSVEVQLAAIDLMGGFDRAYWLVDPVLASLREMDALKDFEPLVIPVVYKDLPKDMRPLLIAGRDAGSVDLLKLAQPCFEYAQQECMCPIPAGQPRPRSLCAFVATAMPAGDVAALLARAAVVSDPHGHQKLLRFWDPRVVQHMKRMPNAPDLLPQGFEGVWTYLDSFGRMKQIVRTSAVPQRQALGNPLDEHQLRWLRTVSELNMLFESAACNQRSPDEFVWQELEQTLDAVGRMALVQAKDRMTFAVMRIGAGVPIERSARLQQMLVHSRDHGIPLESLGAELTDEDWGLIRAEAAA